MDVVSKIIRISVIVSLYVGISAIIGTLLNSLVPWSVFLPFFTLARRLLLVWSFCIHPETLIYLVGLMFYVLSGVVSVRIVIFLMEKTGIKF